MLTIAPKDKLWEAVAHLALPYFYFRSKSDDGLSYPASKNVGITSDPHFWSTGCIFTGDFPRVFVYPPPLTWLKNLSWIFARGSSFFLLVFVPMKGLVRKQRCLDASYLRDDAKYDQRFLAFLPEVLLFFFLLVFIPMKGPGSQTKMSRGIVPAGRRKIWPKISCIFARGSSFFFFSPGFHFHEGSGSQTKMSRRIVPAGRRKIWPKI